MSLVDGYPKVPVPAFRTDTINTDGVTVTIPYTGRGYVVRNVTFYNATGGSSAAALLGVFTGAGGTGQTVVTAAALANLSAAANAQNATLATGATSPILTSPTLTFRTGGTASGTAGTTVQAIVEYANLP